MFDPKKLNIDLENLNENDDTEASSILKENFTKNIEVNNNANSGEKEEIETVTTGSGKESFTNEEILIETDKVDIPKVSDNLLKDILWGDSSDEKDNYSEYWDMKDAPDLAKNNSKDEKSDEKFIFDVNIESLQHLLNILIQKWYNFLLIEPESNRIKIIFKKDKVDKETRYIKYPTYSKILLKAKSITKLEIEWTEDEQQWQWKIVINSKDYKIFSKTIPSGFGEKVFLKLEESKVQVVKKVKKKTSIMQLFAFLWSIAFVALVMGWWFLTFIVLNAKTSTDVQFFLNLGINLNDINTFIWKTVTIIFSLIIFIQTIFLITYLFKFILTKKSYKKKKIQYGIISAIILIITFITWSIWMFIHKKISDLPNWLLESIWNVQMYNNWKLKSDSFDDNSALIRDTSNLIWPLSIKYDLSYYQKREERNWFKIKKYIWNIWGETIEKIEPLIIYDFLEKWTYDISLEIEETDIAWKSITKPIKDLQPVYIGYIVDITEKEISNWWKLVEFDASSLRELWKIEWFYWENLESAFKGETFKPWKPIFKETLVWIWYSNTTDEITKIKQVFVVSWDNSNSIKWAIEVKQMILNDLEYELRVKEPENDFWEGYIKEFKWVIWDKEITKEWDSLTPEESSIIKFTFDKYWKQNISVILKDSSWKTKTLEKTIDIPRKLRLKNWIKVTDNWELVENIRYSSKNKEYFIDELWVPTILTLDSRRVKPDNLLYTLKNITWDIDSDWDIEWKWRTFKYPVDVEWNHHLTIKYTFSHKKIKGDEISFEENIYTEWIKKEALLSLKIEKDSSYAPIIIRFDASKSQVKNQNIVKFIWDYWDWTAIEERWSINPWHRYNKAWDYTIKLTVITEEWNKYSIQKKLILNPKPELAKIDVSIKKAPLGQGIEFSSDLSEWQIEWYYWDFWDWKKAFDANPSHTYKKKWKYKVELKLDFATSNQLKDEMIIEIY